MAEEKIKIEGEFKGKVRVEIRDKDNNLVEKKEVEK